MISPAMWKGISTVRQLGRVASLQPQRTLASTVQARRTFTTVLPRQAAQPQDEEDHYHDRNKLDPQRTESSQSGTTDEVASRDEAFDPTRTSPESEIGASREETRRKGDTRDPLDVSGADKDVGGARDPMEGGAQKNVDKAGHSTRGWPRKNRETKAGKR
ncbi:uncharacterized protein APUU_21360S [Aspergillus puulaauensis]|uniref:Uncharacterized protein n=1 Tax=Aspergillus puulaauensis TaxID=1220207 RepID=A0A7R7XH85_9EURO|nr:uncharacterized protein APUU_21360S [Aspergillus puulaauensis]BCS20928.1 hypothetical protein APUU_21360S [Aspergillus puulaauensis]